MVKKGIKSQYWWLVNYKYKDIISMKKGISLVEN